MKRISHLKLTFCYHLPFVFPPTKPYTLVPLVGLDSIFCLCTAHVGRYYHIFGRCTFCDAFLQLVVDLTGEVDRSSVVLVGIETFAGLKWHYKYRRRNISADTDWFRLTGLDDWIQQRFCSIRCHYSLSWSFTFPSWTF